jgi:DNA-binding response OmpR family regulator
MVAAAYGLLIPRHTILRAVLMPRRYSVLLVEDDDPLRRVLRELLRRQGWDVHATGFGRQAIELASQFELDFSILDMHLPGTTGVEVFRRIADLKGPLPSIMMSGAASAEEQRDALDLGVFSFLHKPLDLASLRATLDQLIRHHFDPSAGGTSPGGSDPEGPYSEGP